jgi:tetratricopeptide (TPR) repeat protein
MAIPPRKCSSLGRNAGARFVGRVAIAVGLAAGWAISAAASDLGSMSISTSALVPRAKPATEAAPTVSPPPMYRLPAVDSPASAAIEDPVTDESPSAEQAPVAGESERPAAAANEAASDDASITPVDEPTAQSTDTVGPTITILPPVDQPVSTVVEAPTVEPPTDKPKADELAADESNAAPPRGGIITILPSVDPPAAPPAAERAAQPSPAEPPREMEQDLERVWSDGFDSTTIPGPQKSAVPAAETATAPSPPQPESAARPPEEASASPPRNLKPYAPTTAELSRQLLPQVRSAYGLAQHGAMYAAQTQFIRVLRRIAEAKDAAEGVDLHAQSLAAGLRALDEADDFAPKGTELEAEMNVPAIASVHRTPVLRGETPLPRPAEAITLYHQYARQQLAVAVGGEQAGSMALYGLGKVHSRLARDAEGQLQHERKALVMYLSALDAAPGNYLAANEIGVLLTRAGEPAAASEMFRRAIDVTPTSTSYHNLAVTDRALGYHDQAAANEQFAEQLAERDRAAGATSRAKGVEWVAPQELSRVAQPMPNEAGNNRVATNAPPPAPEPAGAVETIAKWPQKLVPGIFRR